MYINDFVLYGAGGHGRVVLDVLLASAQEARDILVVDGNSELHGKQLLGVKILSPDVLGSRKSCRFHVAIGTEAVRKRIYQQLMNDGHVAATVIHPLAAISGFSQIAPGGFLAALCVVGPGAIIGSGVIVNHGAVVDHDCVVGNFAHIAPNSTLGGGVRVGQCALVGAGAVVLPGVSIGEGAVIGAGAVVTSDIGNFATVVGNPAREYFKERTS